MSNLFGALDMSGNSSASSGSSGKRKRRRKRNKKKKSNVEQPSSSTSVPTSKASPTSQSEAVKQSKPKQSKPTQSKPASGAEWDSFVDVLVQTHKQFNRDQIVKVVSTVASKGQDYTNVKVIVGLLENLYGGAAKSVTKKISSKKIQEKKPRPVIHAGKNTSIHSKLELAVAHAENGQIAYPKLLDTFSTWVMSNVSDIGPFLKSTALSRLLKFAVTGSSSQQDWAHFTSFLRTLIRVSYATEDKSSAVALASKVGSLFEAVKSHAPNSVPKVVSEIAGAIVDIYNFNGAEVLDLDRKLKQKSKDTQEIKKLAPGLAQKFRLRDARLQIARLLHRKTERFTGGNVKVNDITKSLTTAVASDLTDGDSDAIIAQHKQVMETLEGFTKTRDDAIAAIETRQNEYRTKLEELRKTRDEHKKAIEKLNAKIQRIESEAQDIDDALEVTVQEHNKAIATYESNSSEMKERHKDSVVILQKILDSKKVSACVAAVGGSISAIFSSISSAQQSNAGGSVSAFLAGARDYFHSEEECVSHLRGRVEKSRAVLAKIEKEVADYRSMGLSKTIVSNLEKDRAKHSKNIKADEIVIDKLSSDCGSIFKYVKLVAENATSADREVLKDMGASLVKLGLEAVWGKSETPAKVSKPVATKPAVVAKSKPVAANPVKSVKRRPAGKTKPAPRPKPASTPAFKFSWGKKAPTRAPVKSFAEIEEEQRQAAKKLKETLRQKELKKEAEQKKAEKKKAQKKKAEQTEVANTKDESNAGNTDAVPNETKAATGEDADETVPEATDNEDGDALPQRSRRSRRAIGPAWTRGEIEKPAGTRQEGTMTTLFYTEEQQKRLGVDENGEKTTTAEVTSEDASETKNVETEVSDSASSQKPSFQAYEGEYSEYVTYSDDNSLGVACPDLSNLKLIPKGHHDEPVVIGEGKPALLVFFAKYLKYEAFPAVEACSKYCSELGIQTAGILLDKKEKDVARFIEKKVCKSDFPLYFDNGWVVKGLFTDIGKMSSLTLPALYLIDRDGKIAWRQALTGMTGTMTFDASQFDYQIRAFMAGEDLGSHGPSNQEQDDDEDIGEVEEKDVFATQEVADAVW